MPDRPHRRAAAAVGPGRGGRVVPALQLLERRNDFCRASTLRTNGQSSQWEFPLLAKYRLPTRARPFVDAGFAWDTLEGFGQSVIVVQPRPDPASHEPESTDPQHHLGFRDWKRPRGACALFSRFARSPVHELGRSALPQFEPEGSRAIRARPKSWRGFRSDIRLRIDQTDEIR